MCPCIYVMFFSNGGKKCYQYNLFGGSKILLPTSEVKNEMTLYFESCHSFVNILNTDGSFERLI